MDVLGLGYLDLEVPDAHREAVVNAHPRGDHFKEQIIHAFHDGFCHKWMRQKVKQADKVLLAFTQESGAIRLSDRVGCRTPKGSLRPFSWRTKSPSSAQNSLHITLSGYC